MNYIYYGCILLECRPTVCWLTDISGSATSWNSFGFRWVRTVLNLFTVYYIVHYVDRPTLSPREEGLIKLRVKTYTLSYSLRGAEGGGEEVKLMNILK